jgi:sugar lactone lactonase YvrE
VTASAIDAWLLAPGDDVATAVRALDPGMRVEVRRGDVVRVVDVVERIPPGHKFALRPLAARLRVRKYGEYIGRTTSAIRAGAWLHDHNLETTARRSPDLECALRDAKPPASLRPVGNARCALGESPVWDARDERLFFVDLRDTPAIHVHDPVRDRDERWPMPEDIGCIVPAADGTFVAGLRSGFATFDPVSAVLDYFLDPEPHLAGTRMNDGKCDARGRLWCGSMNPDSAIPEGTLYALEGRERCRPVVDGWLTPNGIAWSLDGATMYVADTRRGTIDAFAFDANAGSLGERRVFVDLAALPGGPDGACVDAEGCLWSAIFDAGCLLRIDPSGRIDRAVRVPVSKPTSCAFGGRDYRTLFVTTASRMLSPSRLAAEPLAGRVLALDVGVAGLAPSVFGANVEVQA